MSEVSCGSMLLALMLSPTQFFKGSLDTVSSLHVPPYTSSCYRFLKFLEQFLPSLRDTFTGIALRRSGILFQFLWGVSGPPEAQLTHTLSNFHCLIHEIYLINHHSSLEHAIYGTSCLLAFLSLTNCHVSNLRSINLIWYLSPLSFSLSSFSPVGALYRPPWPSPGITH